MLTKSDLQAIKEIVDERLDVKLEPLKKDGRSLKRNMTIVKRDTRYMSGKFDEEIVHTRRRVERIENHLKLAPLKQLVKN